MANKANNKLMINNKNLYFYFKAAKIIKIKYRHQHVTI